MHLKIGAMMILRFHSKINWKMTAVFLAAAILLLAIMNPFQKKNSAWDFYRQMVTGYEAIQKVELSELETELKAVVKRRNDCYGNLSNFSSRLTVCRKHYLSDILALARKNIKSSPSLGKFMLCVRECPLVYAMCEGAGLNEGDIDLECTVEEIQCIESCLDKYWRGTD